jgi:hypothetical protein
MSSKEIPYKIFVGELRSMYLYKSVLVCVHTTLSSSRRYSNIPSSNRSLFPLMSYRCDGTGSIRRRKLRQIRLLTHSCLWWSDCDCDSRVRSLLSCCKRSYGEGGTPLRYIRPSRLSSDPLYEFLKQRSFLPIPWSLRGTPLRRFFPWLFTSLSL